MSNELEPTDAAEIRIAEREAKVVSLYARYGDIPRIVKETGMVKRQIEEILAGYRQYSMQDKVLREMSRETILRTRQHYDDLISQMYAAVEVAENEGDYKVQMQGLKSIADIEKQRVDFMQKAGMLADDELGEQIVEAERKQAILVDILKDVMKNYPKVGLEIQQRLKEVTGTLEGVPSKRMDK